MTQLRWDIAAAASLGRADLVKLIRKLRWIGLEEEARQLQRAARNLPPNMRPVTACKGD